MPVSEESAMDRRIVSKLGKVAGLSTLLALASACQDLSSVVTGEKFRTAPEGSPRVEVEVELVVHDSFYESLEDVDRDALEAQMEEMTLSFANLGLRFYPVPADAYGMGDDRPERQMRVEVSDLEVMVDEDTVEQEGQPLRIVARIEGVTCLVKARVEKRRDGPSLVVGSSQAEGNVRRGPRSEDAPEVPTLAVRKEASGLEGLRVEEQYLLDAFEEGVVDALRELVKAVDRDLSAGTVH
jgi:hypothetical protein